MRRLFSTVTMALAALALVPGMICAQGTQPPPGQIAKEAGRLKHFTVTLVLGDTQPGTSDKLTAAETKALADLKDFLPYRKYTVLDTVPIIGLNGPHLLLRGVERREHEFYMRSTDVSLRTTQVDALRLWDGAPGDLVSKGLTRESPVLLIDTSFRIDVGETVVVGTSRLESRQALILLVTAVR